MVVPSVEGGSPSLPVRDQLADEAAVSRPARSCQHRCEKQLTSGPLPAIAGSDSLADSARAVYFGVCSTSLLFPPHTHSALSSAGLFRLFLKMLLAPPPPLPQATAGSPLLSCAAAGGRPECSIVSAIKLEPPVAPAGTPLLNGSSRCSSGADV